MTDAAVPSETTMSRPEATPDDNGDVRLLDVPRAVYRFFYSKRVGLMLILAMCVLTLLGVLFQQMPDQVRSDPQAYASWLESVRPRYRGWTDLLGRLGIFSIFSSIWFKLVTGLLALSVMACTTHRTPTLWRHATNPHTKVKETFFDHGRLHRTVTSDLSPEEAMTQLKRVLAADRYRLMETGGGPGRNLFADKHRFAPFGTVLAHLAFVVILAGVLITSAFGYRNDQFTVPVGTRAEVGQGSGLAVEAVNFTDSYHADGRPMDYVSDLVLYKNGNRVAAQQVRVNTPMKYDGYSINQSYFGIAAQVRVTDAGGRQLYAEGVPLQFRSPDNQLTYGKFELPDQKLQVYVMTAASGASQAPLAAGQMRVETYRTDSNQPLNAQTISQGKPAQVGDLLVTFERERPFTGLTVSRDPGAWWVWTGSFMLVAGTCLTMFLRHHRLWVRVHADGPGSVVRFASPDRTEVGFERHFRRYTATVAGPDAADPTAVTTPADPSGSSDPSGPSASTAVAGASTSDGPAARELKETENA